MNVVELLVKQAQNHPEKAAIIFEGVQISFTGLKDFSFKVSNCLLNIGVKRGDKVAIYLPNTPSTIFSILGIYSIGATLVPLDFMLIENEIINFINHSEVKVLITQPKKNIDLANIKNNCPTLREIITKDTNIDESSPLAPNIEVSDDDLSSIFYTSGSTGHPKGVMLSYKNLDNPSQAIDHFLGLREEDIFLCGGVPFSHVGGLDYILLMIYFSTTIVLMSRFSPLEFLKNIERHKVTIFCIVPAMYIAILALKGNDKFDLFSLKYAVVFGAPSSPVLLKRFHKTCPKATLLNGWGMTETSAPNTLSPKDENKLASIGLFGFNMQTKIVDGELWVKGEPVMKGYYKEPGLTEEVLTKDGWLQTGDLVRQDEEGLYYITGRIKDMIKVAGEIVNSAEVEEKIQRHAKVKETAVIGVADNLRGEVPKAFIVANEGQKPNEQELKTFLKEHLAHFKIPQHFEFVAALPRNRVGKIDKSKLTNGGN